MDLLSRLERALTVEQSYFRAQLLREDLSRLKRLRDLADAATSLDAFLKDASAIEWTPGNLRSWELKDSLAPLLEAFFVAVTDAPGKEADARVVRAWDAFDARRMDRLVGCLARVPKPDAD